MKKTILFIHYLIQNKSSCLKSVEDMFARDGYQKDSGNLPQINDMISINWDDLNEKQQYFVEDLERDIVLISLVPRKLRQ